MTKSEQILLGVLGLVVLGGAAFFGHDALARQERTLNFQRASLRADQAEAQVDLQQQPLFAQRQQWIDRHEPPLGAEGDTQAQLLDAAVKGARDHHLEILQQNLGDVQHGPGGVRLNVELQIKGSMEGLCRWLAELQKPESFLAVGRMSLKADQDQKSIVCTLRLARYFKENGS